MEEKLNGLVNQIEEHFKNCLWDSLPPIKEMDFQLVVLSQKIIYLRDNLANVKDVDKSISELMTFMEGTFHIPMLDYTKWLNENKIRHQLILDVYTNLSNLRTF